MKPQRVDPITGVFQFLGALTEMVADPEGSFKGNRATATTTKLNNDAIIVDTCYPSDTHIYETGIKRISIEGKWVLVEQYPSADKAKKGHDKWVKLMTDYPDYPLKDIDMWRLNEQREENNG